MPETMTVSECAEWLGVSEELLRRAAEERQFPVERAEDGREIVRQDDLDRWMALESFRRMVRRVG